MNLAVITTLKSNSGDNFIYEGFKNVFPSRYFGSSFLVDKTTIPRDDSYQELFDRAKLIVICGSPIFYDGCYKMKWQNKVLEYAKKKNKKLLALAVGSNFKCLDNGDVIFPNQAETDKYSEFIAKYKEVLIGEFIVRDRYCFEFLRKFGLNAHRTVCPSLFASDAYNTQMDKDLIFVIWGSSHWNNYRPKLEVFEICRKVYHALKEKFKDKVVLWVCHDFESYKEVNSFYSSNDILFSNNYIDFLKYYSRCYFAFSVKVHGTMLLASMGTPSVLLQLDSRASVVEALEEEYLRLSTPLDLMIEACVCKASQSSNYKERIFHLKEKYKRDYEEIFERLSIL